MTRYLVIGLVVACVGLAGVWGLYRRAAEERDVYRMNQGALLEDVRYYKTLDSLSAASVERLRLTAAELERHNGELARTVRDLGVLKRLQSVGMQVTGMTVDAVAPVRDTVIVRDTVFVAAKAFDWSDAWVSVSGVMADDGVSFRVSSVDTLVQAVHRVPKRFWFIRWGTKAIRQEVVSKNPHTRVVFAEFIELR
jgi:hypothetical protein